MFELYKILDARRVSLGISKRKLARDANIGGFPALSSYLKTGKPNIGSDSLDKVAETLGGWGKVLKKPRTL